MMYNTEHRPLDPHAFFNDRMQQQAYWLSSSVFGWSLPSDQGQLSGCEFWLVGGDLRVEDGFVRSEIALRLERMGCLRDDDGLRTRLPTLQHLTLFRCPELSGVTDENLSRHFTRDLAFIVRRGDGRAVYATGAQLWPVLDDTAYYEGSDLGVSFDAVRRPTLKLWAPTARSVKLHVFRGARGDAPITTVAMQRQPKGVWSLTGDPGWNYAFYLYELETYVPQAAAFRTYLVTDPYSISLAADGGRSQIVDLDDPATKPAGWDEIVKTALPAFEDIVLYELHVRDFSANDQQIAPELRGKFMAFAQQDSLGMRHLRELAKAGLTHVHLMPVFDFASVPEREEDREEPRIPENLPYDSPVPAETLAKVCNKDSFNWGYDPSHYLAPEGSYATDPDGSARIREFREMVAGLHQAGLRAVMDVVFNHTFRVTDDALTLYDRVVPGYYYRTDGNGAMVSTAVGRSGDVATERRMVEKLMIDALVLWARHYKVDGFRFDLMGFHTKANLRHVREALDRLNLAKDRIDGKGIYLYGEGWQFGSLCDVMPSEACTQHNMYGTGVGTFNDRIRDCSRGGSHSSHDKLEQGFVSGLWYDDNGIFDGEQRRQLIHYYADVIRLGLAGNLRDYKFVNSNGHPVTGGELKYKGAPAGYAARPSETINFISNHDNYDLWDHIAAKAPFRKPERKPSSATINERVRMHRMGLALIALGQGIPFFHAGSDFLRSKSGDNNSYNSGDWFNRIDFSLTDNNWGVGLPPGENVKDWSFWSPRLRDPYLLPTAADLREMAEYFRALLRVRKSSALFRLRSLEEVQTRVQFLETSLLQSRPPGFLCMALRDDLDDRQHLDPAHRLIVAAFNVTLTPVTFPHDLLKGRTLRRHHDWTDSIEPRSSAAKFKSETGTLTIPPQSLIVYVEPRTKR